MKEPSIGGTLFDLVVMCTLCDIPLFAIEHYANVDLGIVPFFVLGLAIGFTRRAWQPLLPWRRPKPDVDEEST